MCKTKKLKISNRSGGVRTWEFKRESKIRPCFGFSLTYNSDVLAPPE